MNVLKIVIGLTLILMSASIVSAGWVDTDYLYRQEIILIGNTSGAQTNYPVLLNVTHDSKMRADFGNIRFGDSSNIMDAWLESNTSDYALIWVEFATTPANSVNQTYYMYYGDMSVTSDWNGSATFYQYHGSGWTNFLDAAIVPPTNVAFKGKIRSIAAVHNLLWGLSNNAVIGDDALMLQSESGGNLRYLLTADEGVITSVSEAPDYILNQYYYGEITNNGSYVHGYIDGNEISSGINTNLPDENLGLWMWEVTGHGQQEWSFARKYVDFAATYSFENNESIFIKYNETTDAINIVEPDSCVHSFGVNDTKWLAAGLVNNVTINVQSYNNSIGTFQITDGILDWIQVRNLTYGDLIMLKEGTTPIEVGIVDVNGEYIFNENINLGTYTIMIKSYDNVTGVHGFVFEGTTGVNNPLESVNVYIFNTTWSSSMITDTGGYFAFENLTNTTYTLNFKKDRYESILYQYITPINASMHYKPIWMQKKTGDYYSRHYCTFTLKNIWQIRYSNVDTIVYENSNVVGSGTTGYDGSIVFHLFEDVEYKITFVDASQGIDEELTLYPRDNEYTIYVSSYDFSLEDSERGDTVNWWYLKGDINLTHSWLNFTYRDTENKTSFIEYWINDTNNTNLYYTNQTYPSPIGIDYEVNRTVNASNHTYVVHFSAIHPDYPELQNSAIQTISYYTGKLIDLAFSEQWHYTVTAICIIFFIAMFAGSTNVGTMSVIICLSAWFFSFIQWLPTSIIGYGSLVFATILSVSFAMRKSEMLHS